MTHRLSKFSPQRNRATCEECGGRVEVVMVYDKRRYNPYPRCLEGLRQSKRRDAAKRTRRHLPWREAQAFLAGKVCEICGLGPEDGVTLCVDHSHRTGQTRGALCHHCNLGLGHFRDDPLLLEAAVRYLKSAAQATG